MWGWKENSAEQAQDKAELSQLAKEGKPLYGESDLPEYIQGVAHRNSMWSQLKFGVMPWFNFVKFVQLPRCLVPPFSSSPLAVPVLTLTLCAQPPLPRHRRVQVQGVSCVWSRSRRCRARGRACETSEAEEGVRASCNDAVSLSFPAVAAEALGEASCFA